MAEKNIVPISEVPAQFKLSDAAIAKLKEEYGDLTVKGVDDKDTIKLVKKGEKQVRKYRTSVEKIRKDLKKPALEYGKTVDSEAKRLTGELVPIEQHLKGQLDFVEQEKERIKQEKTIRRMSKLTHAGFTQEGGVFRAGGVIVYEESIGGLKEETFQEFIDNGVEELDRLAEEKRRRDAEEKARKEEDARLEAERKELARQQAEQQEQLRKEREELEQMKRELEDEKARLASLSGVETERQGPKEPPAADESVEATSGPDQVPDTPDEEPAVPGKAVHMSEAATFPENEAITLDEYNEKVFGEDEVVPSRYTPLRENDEYVRGFNDCKNNILSYLHRKTFLTRKEITEYVTGMRVDPSVEEKAPEQS